MPAIKVISQQPPGGRCTLYAGYAEVLARHLATPADIVFSVRRDAHGAGFPSLLLDGIAIQPADGVLLMPGDLLEALAGLGIAGDHVLGLAEALEAHLERLLEEGR